MFIFNKKCVQKLKGKLFLKVKRKKNTNIKLAVDVSFDRSYVVELKERCY